MSREGTITVLCALNLFAEILMRNCEEFDSTTLQKIEEICTLFDEYQKNAESKWMGIPVDWLVWISFWTVVKADHFLQFYNPLTMTGYEFTDVIPKVEFADFPTGVITTSRIDL